MVTADGTDAFVLGKRTHDSRGRGDARQRQRKQIRKMSMQLVRSGQIPKKPCLLCGSRNGLTIHHIEPMRPDRFVFLCQPRYDRAHPWPDRAHRPLYRTISLPRPFGQFSIRPEAAIPRKVVCRG